MTTGRPKLKVVIVGCGKIADAHVEEVGKVTLAEVVAVCDREALMAEQLAVRYGVPRHFSDFAAMLDAVRPDVVHITTPPQSRRSPKSPGRRLPRLHREAVRDDARSRCASSNTQRAQAAR
jgi:ornithine cyclodeaminase/alanine dehydrogenase-like protein (mu-crystallin family)